MVDYAFIRNENILDYCILNDSIIITSDMDGSIRFSTLNDNITELGISKSPEISLLKMLYLLTKTNFSLGSSNKVYLYRRISNESHVQLDGDINPFSEIFILPMAASHYVFLQ